MNKITQELRQSFDSADGFISGHQIITIRKGCRRTVPDWVNDAGKFKEVLLNAFPKMNTNEKQRRAAGRWARIFYLYYKGNYTSHDISVEMGLSIPQVEFTLVSIRRVAGGFSSNTKGKNKSRTGTRGRRLKSTV